MRSKELIKGKKCYNKKTLIEWRHIWKSLFYDFSVEKHVLSTKQTVIAFNQKLYKYVFFK